MLNGGTLANIVHASVQYNAWEITGKAPAIYTVDVRQLPELGGNVPSSADGWRALGRGFGWMARLTSEEQELRALLVSSRACTQRGLDVERLVAEATPVFKETRPLPRRSGN